MIKRTISIFCLQTILFSTVYASDHSWGTLLSAYLPVMFCEKIAPTGSCVTKKEKHLALTTVPEKIEEIFPRAWQALWPYKTTMDSRYKNEVKKLENIVTQALSRIKKHHCPLACLTIKHLNIELLHPHSTDTFKHEVIFTLWFNDGTIQTLPEKFDSNLQPLLDHTFSIYAKNKLCCEFLQDFQLFLLTIL